MGHTPMASHLTEGNKSLLWLKTLYDLLPSHSLSPTSWNLPSLTFTPSHFAESSLASLLLFVHTTHVLGSGLFFSYSLPRRIFFFSRKSTWLALWLPLDHNFLATSSLTTFSKILTTSPTSCTSTLFFYLVLFVFITPCLIISLFIYYLSPMWVLWTHKLCFVIAIFLVLTTVHST